MKRPGTAYEVGTTVNEKQDGVSATAWKEGDVVEVFYRFEHDGSGDMGDSYFPVLTHDAGLINPRIGQTDSWQQATVLEDYDAARFDPEDRSTWVRVGMSARKWSNRKGVPLDLKDPNNTTVTFVPRDVRTPSHEAPLVSFFVCRWGGPYPVPEHSDDGEFGGWGDIGTCICDKYIRTFFNVVYGKIGPRYEVFSCFVSQSADMSKLYGPTMSALMKGSVKAGMYFLWPVAWRDCNEGAQGYVEKHALMGAMRTMEASGIPTRHPHPSNLYHVFASKEWTSQLCLAKQFCVPCTTRVNRALILENPRKAAERAADAILALQRSKYGSTKYDESTIKGVAKLGYSWEAQDVLAFRGVDELALRLERLLEQQGCLAEFVFVQEHVENDCEVRHYLINGQVRKTFYSRFCSVDDAGSFSSFRRIADREVVLKEWFHNNDAGLKDAEAKMEVLTEQWLTWFRCEHPDPPAVCRFDFFVALHADGTSTVTTGELTEQGASTLGWSEGPQVTFEAVLDVCMEDLPRNVRPCSAGTPAARRRKVEGAPADASSK